jgi:hypothetical protein
MKESSRFGDGSSGERVLEGWKEIAFHFGLVLGRGVYPGLCSLRSLRRGAILCETPAGAGSGGSARVPEGAGFGGWVVRCIERFGDLGLGRFRARGGGRQLLSPPSGLRIGKGFAFLGLTPMAVAAGPSGSMAWCLGRGRSVVAPLTRFGGFWGRGIQPGEPAGNLLSIADAMWDFGGGFRE